MTLVTTIQKILKNKNGKLRIILAIYKIHAVYISCLPKWQTYSFLFLFRFKCDLSPRTNADLRRTVFVEYVILKCMYASKFLCSCPALLGY